MKYAKFIIATIATLFLLTACAGGSNSYDISSNKIDELSVRFDRLTRIVQTAVYAESIPENTKGFDIVKLAAQDNEELLDYFNMYKIDAAIKTDVNGNKWAVLLLCTKDNNRALIERTGCTSQRSFTSHWRTNSPCKFTMDINKICN